MVSLMVKVIVDLPIPFTNSIQKDVAITINITKNPSKVFSSKYRWGHDGKYEVEEKKLANLPRITWGESKTRLQRAIHRRNRKSGIRSEIYRQQQLQENLAALQTPPKSPECAARVEETWLFQGVWGWEKLGGGALISLLRSEFRC